MDSRMGRFNSNAINRASNRTFNGSNLTPVNMPANGTLYMIDLNIPFVPERTEEDCSLYETSNYTSGGISMYGTSHTVSDSVTDIRNDARSSLQTQNLWLAPTGSSSQTMHIHGDSRINLVENNGTSRTMRDFVTDIRNTSFIPSEILPNNARSSLQSQNLWHAPTVASSQTMRIPGASRINLVENSGTSRTVSDFVTDVRNTSVIQSETFPNNARSSLQMQSMWHAPTVSSSQTMNIPGASMINLMENSTYLMFGEQHTNIHGASSSSSWYQSNAVIQPSSGPPALPLVIGESTFVADNRERLLAAGGHFREPGHRDDPIVIEDDDEDEHADGQQGVIFYDGDMSYEALLELQERIGDVGTGLKKKVISDLLKHRKYQSTKVNDCSDSCCVCLGTYEDRDELGKIDCNHEFHYHCIRKWLLIKNSCPICKKTALTP